LENALEKWDVAPDAGAKKDVNVERWLGRHEALDLVARTCSAADIRCLKEIRDEKKYLDVAPNWDRFCNQELGSSRKKVDTMIRRLDEFGPAYFELASLTHVSPEEFRLLPRGSSDNTIDVDGESVPIAPENRDKLKAAVTAARHSRRTEAAKKTFRDVLQACETAVEQLENPPANPDMDERFDLVAIMLRMLKASEGLGAAPNKAR